MTHDVHERGSGGFGAAQQFFHLLQVECDLGNLIGSQLLLVLEAFGPAPSLCYQCTAVEHPPC